MTYYEVDLKDVVSNYREAARHTRALCVPMLKANGYGLGAAAVADALEEEGVHAFAVSRLEEADEIAAPGRRIWVLSCYHTPAELSAIVEKGYTAAVDGVPQAEEISRLALAAGRTAVIHIKVDTGFGRFGFAPDAVEDICRVCALPGIEAQGIFSHLGAAFLQKDPSADKQLALFERTVDALKEAGVTFPLCHIAGSSGLARGEKFHLDAVRVGSLLCGRMPAASEMSLKRVGRLCSEIIDVRPVGKGHFIGYGNVYKTRRPTRVAVLAVGYADGVQTRKDYDTFRFRDLCRYGADILKMLCRRDNRMYVTVNGKRAPVIGRVALTHTMIDVTDIECRPGDTAEIPVSPLLLSADVERRYLK